MFYVFGLNNPATTGQATTALTGFDRVIGIDPSESMIQKARAGSTAVLTTTTTTTPAPAAKSANASSAPRISFLNHAAEDLDFIDDASIDLVISGSLQTSLFVTTPHHAFIIIIIIIISLRAAQAAHWFDYTRLWPQLARVLKRNGTVAFWVTLPSLFPSPPH